ncbi:MAG: translation initiation factor IF-3 [Candidatus Zixiibacteriota bacterium]|nr:MAG: translation initiation factor IF-3 [candidate division Zixibacteria bacterium]
MAKLEVRVNTRIKVSPVRLIGPSGEQIGILPIGEALDRAREQGLDLVEVAPNSRPPVCRIMDYGKYKYELAKKDKISKKKQHSVQMKEMRYRPKIDDHDYRFKTNHVREFLESGSKVRVFVMFRGREMTHQEFGRRILDRVRGELEDIAQVDVEPKMEGYTMSMILSPISAKTGKTRAEPAERAQPEQTTTGSE